MRSYRLAIALYRLVQDCTDQEQDCIVCYAHAAAFHFESVLPCPGSAGFGFGFSLERCPCQVQAVLSQALTCPAQRLTCFAVCPGSGFGTVAGMLFEPPQFRLAPNHTFYLEYIVQNSKVRGIILPGFQDYLQMA